MLANDAAVISTGAADRVRTVALDLPYGTASSNRLDVFTPTEGGARPTFVWVHGGGFIGGTKDDARPYLQLLAAEGFTTVGVEYTLAPRGRYPRPVHEVAAAVRHVVDRADEFGVDPTRIVLGGDSAGAHISGQLGFAITDAGYADATGLPRPIPTSSLRSLVLSCGVFDLTIGHDAPGMAGWIVRSILWSYGGTRHAVGDPVFGYASLVDHVPTDLPPVYVTAGNEDPLRRHTTRFARALVAAGVEVVDDTVERDHQPGLPHDYQMDMRNERSWESLARVTELIRRTTD